jgi:chromate transporter
MKGLKRNKLLQLFSTMFKIGCIGFGGGNALIPVIYRKIVKENELLTEEEYDEDVLIASITPGALPVEIAGGIGRRLCGWKGMLIGAYGIALPGVIFTIFLLIVFEFVNDDILQQTKYVSIGISAFICVLLLDYIKGTFENKSNREKIRNKYFDLMIIASVFVLTCGKSIYRILGISTSPLFGLASIDIFILFFFFIFSNAGSINIWRIIMSAIISILYIAYKGQRIQLQLPCGFVWLQIVMITFSILGMFVCIRKQNKINNFMIGKNSERIKDILALATVTVIFMIPAVGVSKYSLLYGIKGALSSAISFGGGDAYITVVDGMFVDSDMIPESYFYGDIVPVVNILPGSILCKTLSAIGFYIGKRTTGLIVGGIIVALFGFSVSIFASCGIFSIIYMLYGTVSEIPIFVTIKNYIRPIVSGLMLTVILSLIYQAKIIGDDKLYGWGYVIVLSLCCVVCSIIFRRKWNNIKTIGIMVTGALVMCNFMDYVR